MMKSNIILLFPLLFYYFLRRPILDLKIPLMCKIWLEQIHLAHRQKPIHELYPIIMAITLVPTRGTDNHGFLYDEEGS